MQASANRILTQSEVLHLLQHDTLSGLFMYLMAIIRQRDTHKYNDNHIPMTFRYDASYSINLWDTDVINHLHILLHVSDLIIK